MNSVNLVGRLTDKALWTRTTTQGGRILKFKIIVDKSKKGETYFIPCVAFDKIAETILTYFGDKYIIGINGEIAVNRFQNPNDQGKNIKETIEVRVSKIDFTISKAIKEAANLKTFKETGIWFEGDEVNTGGQNKQELVGEEDDSLNFPEGF